MPASGLTRDEWADRFARIGEYLRERNVTAVLEIIGAWPVMESGMPGRTSMDLDVWLPGSRFDHAVFRDACHAAGLEFDPTTETDRPYIQIVRPGLVHVPPHEPEFSALFGSLTVQSPPPAALIASKLVRGAAKDIEDVLYLQSKFGISTDAVAGFASQITDRIARETATENLVYLRLSTALPDSVTLRKPDSES
jgi:hypothetical protein